MPEQQTVATNPNVAKQRILSASREELNKDLLESLFSAYHDRESGEFKNASFDPTARIQLTHTEYQWVQDTIETTLGMLFMNRFILEYCGVIEHVGYWNRELNKKNLGALDTAVNNLVVTDKIDTKTLGLYIDRRDTLGFQSASFLSVSISAALIRPMPNVAQRKAELMQEHAEVLQSNNPVEQIMAMNGIEKELMGIVRKNLEQDTGYDLYASGDGNLDNNYKTINVMRGAVFNNITQRYDIVDSSLMDGVRKKDIPAFSNSIVAGAYPSAIGTADSGYMAKIILALLQSEHLDPDPNSDCGTNVTIPLTITKNNKQYALYRYINDGGKRVLTTMDNIDNYVGKTVALYSPQCCLQESICGKCAGRVFHNLGVTQVGLLVTAITQKMLNLKLKSKHDLSQKAAVIPKEYIFIEENKYFSIDNGVLKNKAPMKIFIPKAFDEFSGFSLEATLATCFGVMPVKFYDNNGKEILSTRLTIPAMLTFNIYDDIQEDADYYIISYEADSSVCYVQIQQNAANVEYFINQIYLHSKSPQLPYELMTEMMFRCLEINSVDLNGPSITYEMMARRVCRHNGKPFSFVYGKNPNTDTLKYDKLRYREAVQRAGILQGLLFEDITTAINVGLAQSLNGITPTETPLEKVIKA